MAIKLKKNEKQNKKHSKGSFSILLIKNYIGLSILVAILFLGLLYLFTTMQNRYLNIANTEAFLEQIDLIKEEKYIDVRVERYLGSNGYFEILDGKANIRYTSKKNNNKYTMNEVNSIPNIQELDTFISVSEFGTKGTETKTLIAKDVYNHETGEVVQEDFVILNADLIVEYSSNLISEDYTKEKIQYMKGKDLDGFYIERYPYVNAQGKDYSLIIHIEEVTMDKYYESEKIYSWYYPTFFICYILLIGVFIYGLNIKVKKPLSLLNHAILEFSKGNRESKLEYYGPKEFVQICDSFNEMSQRLMESEQEQKRLQHEKQKMLADISHDLKTPITVIQGYSKAICDGVVAEDKKEQYLNTIYKKVNGLTKLINEFHEYSKLEHPEFKLILEKDDICEYVREYFAEKYEEIDLAGLMLEVEIPEEPIWCYFDSVQLKRVFENLLANALKHHKSGHVIFVELKEEGNDIIMYIANDGDEIPPEIINTIFKPFVVGEASRTNKQGTGLGLAISYRIMIAHGGTIQLLTPSRKGFGTEFELRLKIFGQIEDGAL